MVGNGELHDLFKIVVSHEGRTGDSPVELASLELRLTDSAGVALTEAQALALLQTVRLFVDDGSGAFDGPDTLVAYDSGSTRLSRFSTRGEFLSSVTFRGEEGAPGVYLGTVDTGDHVVAGSDRELGTRRP